MKTFPSLKIFYAIVLFAFYSLPSHAQIISVTAGTDSTVNVIGGEQFADPNDGTKGGLGGDCSTVDNNNPGNYPNCNCITLTTLTAPVGQQVSVTFSEFRVFGNFDWLAIFDGDATVSANNGSGSVNNPSSTDPLLWNSSVDGVEFTDMFANGAVTFSSTNGSLTFASRFSGVVDACGWVADVALCEGDGCPRPLGPAPSSAFVTMWEVDDNDVISIPLQSGTYNFDYAWEHLSDTASISGTHTNVDGDFTTNFVKAGTYRLSITGQFPHLKGYPVSKLRDVIQWGAIQWENMGNMFQNWQGTGFSATDAPDLSQATNMRQMFLGASNFNDNLNHWDVSNIQNMGFLFRGATSFNNDIGKWNVSNVTEMEDCFRNATSFNQDISKWDVSKVRSMRQMFDNADSFNQPIGTWDVSNVDSFREMFRQNDAFNQSLGGWKFKSSANFLNVFGGARAFDCEQLSSTLIGWNLGNPDLENIGIRGPIGEYDTLAAISRDELLARGWILNSQMTAFEGNCEAEIEFPCQNEVIFSNDTLYSNLLIKAAQKVDFENIVVIKPARIQITAPVVNISPTVAMENEIVFEIRTEPGCEVKE